VTLSLSDTSIVLLIIDELNLLLCCICCQRTNCGRIVTGKCSATSQCGHNHGSGESQERADKYRAIWNSSCEARHSRWYFRHGSLHSLHL